MALTDNLISYWKLDEASGNAIDAVGDNDLTDSNTVGATTGKISGARDFEADNNELFSLASNTDLSVTSDQSFSIGGWVYAETSGYKAIVFKSSTWPNSTEYALYTYDGSIYGLIGNGSTYGNPTGVAFNAATWYHVFLTYDAGTDTISVYVNGSANTASLSGGGTSSGATFYMGADLSGGGAGIGYWDGLLDEFGLWKRCLSSAEVGQLYAGGTGLAYPFSGGPQTIAVNRASETDAAQAVGKQKTKALGQTSETDAAQAIAKQKNKAAGQAAETDSAAAIARVKTKALGQAAETDAAQVIAVGGSTVVPVGQVAETDAAQAITWAPKHRMVGLASETDAAQALAKQKILALGQSAETDAAQAITPVIADVIAVGQATETDAAQAVAWSPKHRLAGQAAETDEARAITRRKVAALAQVSETDAALAFAARKVRAMLQAIEADTALSITASGGSIVPVYGWGGRAKVGTTVAIDRNKRIGSSQA